MPVTATTAIIALAGTGLGVSLYGQYRQGQAAEQQAKSQAAWHEYNAKLAEREAKESQAAAAYEETKHRKAGARLKAKQRMGYLATGVTLEGTALDFLEEQATEIETDALMIRRGGQLGYQRFESEAALQRMSGRSALLRGRSARRASLYGMAGTAVSGAAGLGYQYGTMTGKYPRYGVRG